MQHQGKNVTLTNRKITFETLYISKGCSEKLSSDLGTKLTISKVMLWYLKLKLYFADDIKDSDGLTGLKETVKKPIINAFKVMIFIELKCVPNYENLQITELFTKQLQKN